jgi:hypothetical protein
MTLRVKATEAEAKKAELAFPCLMRSKSDGWIMLVTGVENNIVSGMVVSDPNKYWSSPILRYSNRMTAISTLEPWVGKVEFISE